VMPPNLATLAPSGRVVTAVPTDFAASAEATGGQPDLCYQAVLSGDKAGAYVRSRIERDRFCGRRREQRCRSNSDKCTH
jgi:hypothetical protein